MFDMIRSRSRIGRRSKTDRYVKRAVSVCLSVILLLSSAVSGSAASLPSGSGTEAVRMGFFEFGGMFEGAEEGAVKSGYCYEYMMEVATYTGWNYEFVYGSYSELYDLLVRGEIDILPYTNYNEDRGREALFSDLALAQEEYYIAARSVDAEQLGGDPGSLNGKVISTLEGADYNSLLLDYIAENGLDLRVVYYPSLSETWDAVLRGDADVTVFTSNAYSAEGYVCLCTFGRKPTYIAIAKDRPELLSVLNTATRLIDTENPALQGQLYAKYFLDNPMWRSMTQEEQEWIDAHPVLRIGGFSENPTDLQITEGTAAGLTVDLIDGIREKLGLDVSCEYSCYNTIDEMREALSSGEIDVIYPFYPDYNIAREYDLVISKTVRKADMELVYRQGTSYADALTRIATPVIRLGIFYIRKNFPDSVIVRADSVADAVRKVRKGEALGAVAYSQAIQTEKNKYWDLDSVILLEDCGTCFAAKPEDHALIMVLNRGLNYFTTAEISALSSRHFVNPKVSTVEFLKTHREIDILLIVILLILLVLAFLLVMMSRLKKKADQANRTKSAFLFNMSHDIRTPMNAILGYTDVGLRHVEDPETSAESYRKIRTAGGHLLNLINEVLEMSRIESGALELVESETDIREAIRNVTGMSESLAVPKSIAFTTEVGEIRDPYIYADKLHCDEIIINLISNAIKYTNAGGRVTYRVSQVGKAEGGKAWFRFEISDNGIGMSEEFQSHLFEAFSREKNTTVSGTEGTGLGLSIVKKIVDLAGGRISVRSKVGEGSTFLLEIPFRVMGEDAIRKMLDTSAAERKAVGRSSLVGKRVLLVEDNDMNREIASDLLTDAGLSVEEAEDGSIALKAVREKGAGYYDFILMDIQMPVMNGYEATKAIRALPNGENIPIIALSANAFEEDRQRSIAEGMNAHIAKPINVETLFETIQESIY